VANQQLTESSSRHAVYVQRVAGGLDDEFLPYLERLKKDVSSWIVLNDWDQLRQRDLLRELTSIQTEIYNEYNKQLILDLGEVGLNDAKWQQRQIKSVLPDDFDHLVTTPPKSAIISVIKSTPLVFEDANQVKLLQPFIRDWSASEINRVNGIIQTGFLTGQSNREIAKAVAGKGGYLDKQVRQHNETLVRTAVNHTATVARDAVMKDNDDIIIGYRWLSTLDGRTSDICRGLDQQVFKTDDDYQPKPPAHPGCRSTTIPEINPDLQPKSKRGKRGSSGDEGREPVGANTTYYGWLKKQTAQFQDETIGPTRGKLLRNGGLTSEEFRRLSTDDKFRPLDLESMRKKSPESFENAGL
jgi:SPP1 gp7 family putative phage head morphogenesis protein